MRDMRDTLSGAATKVGTALIPIITKLMSGIQLAIPILRDTFAPIWTALQELWAELQPTLETIVAPRWYQ